MPHGPFKHFGSQGWVIAIETRILWKGSSPVMGYPDNPSFRTETVGYLAILRMIFHLYTFWSIKIPKKNVTFRTDSLSMIQKLSGLLEYDEWYASIYQQHHIDVSLQVKLATLDLKPLVFVLEHVRGHADRDKKWMDLTRPEQVNVMCDA